MNRILTLSLFFLLAVISGYTQDVTVTSNLDDGSGGTLREAIASAGDGGTITFQLTPGSETIVLNDASGELLIDKGLTIDGSVNATRVTVQVNEVGTTTHRVFRVIGGANTVNLNNLIAKGGDITDGAGAAGYGGVISLTDAILSLDNVIIDGGKAVDGGGINVDGGTLNTNNLTIENNEASSSGGGIGTSSPGSQSATLDLTQTFITGNTAQDGSGGGVYLILGSLTIDQAVFQSNSANTTAAFGRGGAIYCGIGTMTTISSTTFVQNQAGDDGGAIYNLDADLTISNSDFGGPSQGNTAVNFGGAISFAGSSTQRTLNISNTTFRENSSEQGGGVHQDMESTLNISTSTFKSNSATAGSGGGMYIVGPVDISQSTFDGNTANQNGGGIEDQSEGSLTITNSTLSGNQAGQNGGGISGEFGTATISFTTIANNTAATSGGGMYANFASITVSNSILSNNTENNQQFDFFNASALAVTDLGYNIVKYQNGTDFNQPTDILYDGSQWLRNGSTVTGKLNISTTLADNGGPTETLAFTGETFAEGSGLFDAGVPQDQRGANRVDPPTIGAVEIGVNPLFTWTAGEGNNWADPGNWDTGLVPGPGDNVLIPTTPSGNNTFPIISVGTDAQCNDVEVQSGASLTILGNLDLTGSEN